MQHNHLSEAADASAAVVSDIVRTLLVGVVDDVDGASGDHVERGRGTVNERGGPRLRISRGPGPMVPSALRGGR